MKRYIRLDGIDKELVLSKIASIKVDKKMIYLDELQDGTWRLNYTDSLIPDISKLKGLTIVRED